MKNNNSKATGLVSCLIGAVLAGFAIGLGGLCFLSVENRVVGAALFTVGLFTVCTLGLNLFTGKVCYVFENDRAYALRLPLIWLGNLLGAGLAALPAALTRRGPELAEKAAALCRVKLDDSLLSLFFLNLLNFAFRKLVPLIHQLTGSMESSRTSLISFREIRFSAIRCSIQTSKRSSDTRPNRRLSKSE